MLSASASTLDDLPERLAARLASGQPLPGRHGLSPAMSYGRHSGPARADARAAAVLVLLYPHQNGWHLPLTRRTAHLTAHGGQVSLPGGSIEADETPAEAALREAEEELGIPAANLTLLGTLSPVYVFNSNFLITPWVAATRQAVCFRPNPAEVAELIELPLGELLRPENTGRVLICRGALQFSAPYLQWHGITVWGATHVVLGELGRILRGEPAGGLLPSDEGRMHDTIDSRLEL
jgi:8-oxo-dGTP pyrophosphatase MutT (NUDIX family)